MGIPAARLRVGQSTGHQCSMIHEAAGDYKDRLISSGRATSNNLRLTLMLLLHEDS